MLLCHEPCDITVRHFDTLFSDFIVNHCLTGLCINTKSIAATQWVVMTVRMGYILLMLMGHIVLMRI